MTLSHSLPASSYVSYQRGDLPLLITVPHGGYYSANEIPERIESNGTVLTTDRGTAKTAQAVADKIFSYYGCRPYMVVCNIRRRKEDVNRPIHLATESSEGQAVWKVLHIHFFFVKSCSLMLQNIRSTIDLYDRQ